LLGNFSKNLPDIEKISVTPTEMPFSWKQVQTMTAKEFETTVLEMWKHKDLIMGNNAINELYRIFDGADLRKKALIIYNMPHSCRYFKYSEKYPFFAYQIIADRFPGRVANVMLNWAVFSDADDGYYYLSNGGKLDAAFAACDYKSIGFDLTNSPFEELVYDIDREVPLDNKVKMKDVYHGFIFYKPVFEWVIGIGVPNLDKIDCKDEIARRTRVYENTKKVNKNDEFRYYSKIRTFPMTIEFEKKQYDEQINHYFKILDSEK
jgi:hypothetical protein